MAKYCVASVTTVKKGTSEGRAKREIKRALCTHQERKGLETLKT
jgi:hypothetical protein